MLIPAFRELMLVFGLVSGIVVLVAWADMADLANVGQPTRQGSSGDERGPAKAVYRVCVLGDSGRFAYHHSGNAVSIGDVQTGETLRVFERPLPQILSLAASPDGRSLLVGHVDGSVCLWSNVDNLPEVREVTRHKDQVWGVSFANDGRHFMTGGELSSIYVWDADTLHCRRKIEMASASFRVVRFTPDGKRLLSGESGGTIRLWDVATGRELRSWRDHTNIVIALEPSPDGRQVVSVDQDGLVRAWHLETGDEIWRNRLDGNMHRGLAVSPDGTAAATAGPDGRLHVYDMQTGRSLAVFAGHPAGLRGVSFLADGQSLLSCGYDGALCRWSIPSQSNVWRVDSPLIGD